MNLHDSKLKEYQQSMFDRKPKKAKIGFKKNTSIDKKKEIIRR